MAGIYSGCYMVIGATRACTCDDGFLKPRERVINVGSYSFWNTTFEIFTREYLDHSVSLGSVKLGLARCPLLDRGWCFQERILAPRMLHFANRELVYHCREGRECECGWIQFVSKPSRPKFLLWA